MEPKPKWRQLGIDHPCWDVLRYYRSLRKSASRWLTDEGGAELVIGEKGSPRFPVSHETARLVREYIQEAPADLSAALDCLRTEEEALAYCQSIGAPVTTTKTKNEDHHQSSSALVAAVSAIAQQACACVSKELVHSPQRRAVWWTDRHLHVTARNLDGALPSLSNPDTIWEIKEYWGVTKGGSKMSDAVYECHLVGRELRDFEHRSGIRVTHIVFVDGRHQWGYRKSDLVRFIDLFHQGLIDHVFFGREVESGWRPLLDHLLGKTNDIAAS